MPRAFSTSATPPTRPQQRAMNNRDIETRLARATLVALVFYFPIETWASWGHDYWLLNPFYLIDLAAMGLLLYGATRSLRAQPTAGAWRVVCCLWLDRGERVAGDVGARVRAQRRRALGPWPGGALGGRRSDPAQSVVPGLVLLSHGAC